MAYTPDKHFHEEWLGLAQPIHGLMFSVPVLVESGLWQRADSAEAAAFVESLAVDGGDTPSVASLAAWFEDFLGFYCDSEASASEVCDSNSNVELHVQSQLPDDLSLVAAEGAQLLRPTFALPERRPSLRGSLVEAESTKASVAGQRYGLLAWEIPRSLDFDTRETETGAWNHPPVAKFERLLRQTRVPLGLLSNGDTLRLVFAPHGEATGWIDWPIAAMASAAGRPILSAFLQFFPVKKYFGEADERSLLGILQQSRDRQADVTNELAEQVYEAIRLLLEGFARCDQRAGTNILSDALRTEGEEHVYTGLLTVLLRLVFVLYAEELEVLPTDNEFYQKSLSLLSLFDELQEFAGRHPETMVDRRGAWPRLIALFRAIFFGARYGSFQMVSRRGELFDPERFPFLEGRQANAGGAPGPKNDRARSTVRTPSIEDGVVLKVLQALLIVDGERLSYRTLNVEQIGSVYERLMGYHVLQLTEPAVCVKPKAVWVSPSDFAGVTGAKQLTSWLKDEARLPNSAAKRLSKLLKKAESDDERMEALRTETAKTAVDGVVGQFVIQPGDERRRTSSHYTPRSLTTGIVQKTLDPLMAALGERPSSQDILDLKICDPAMGSGAFLVECCRYLGKRLEAAWTYEGVADTFGDQYDNLENHARRMIAQRCLYGVDKNAMAVDLARVSLWLVTLSRSLPFTFVDHALRHGDSVVGFSLDQARNFHWKRDKQQSIFAVAVNKAMSEAIELRQRIVERADDESEQAQTEKSHLLDDAEYALQRARLIADVALGAFFAESKSKARNAERERRALKMHQYLEAVLGDEAPTSEECRRLEAELREWQREIREEHEPFHWMLEFPEVFYAERRDPLAPGAKHGVAYMDAFVGNPPFMGGSQISGAFGGGYRDWLLAVHLGSHGNSDFSAHFFRRCASLLGAHGTIGLIATNTIGQGDTRSTGLQWLAKQGYEIYTAEENKAWPGEAAITISTAFLAKGTPRKRYTPRQLNGELVEQINSRLKGKPERPDPVKLSENANQSFLGAKIYGQGFTLTPEERDELVAKDERNAERIFPYLGGREVNSNPDQGFDRYVINFGQLSLGEAERWPDLIEIVRRQVKPDRDKNKRKVRREKWWWFGEPVPGMFTAIAPLKRCVVTARVSKAVTFSFQPADRVFSEQLYVFPREEPRSLATLQSRIHSTWAWALSSTMRNAGIRYSATDCFENFPFPRGDEEQQTRLDTLGERLHEERRAWTMGNDQGLTQLYNALKDPKTTDPDVLTLRELHLDVDRAVLDAYGWSDIEVPPYEEYDEDNESPEAEAIRAAQQAFEDEVMDRLYALNAERSGRATKTKAKGVRKGKGRGKGGGVDDDGDASGQGELL